jgi:hypothetical protein
MKYSLMLAMTFLLLGAGCVFGQPSSPSDEVREPPQTETRKDIPGVIDDEEIPTESDVDVTKPDPVELEKLPPLSKLCTDPPESIPIGREVYPIDERYDGLHFLGQLFTAARCSDRRARSLWEVKDDIYILGSTINLKEPPNEDMTKTLRWIGFICDEGVGDGVCTRWELNGEVPYESLLYLEPFHEMIEIDDCRNCG